VAAERPKWPHLENLDKVLALMPDFFDDVADRESGIRRQWSVTEKLHGFNARFGVDDDGIAWVGGRNEIAEEGDPADWDRGRLQGFVGFAADKVKGLARGETLFGEWAGKGVQKGIDYGPKDFYAFGVIAHGKLQSWAGLVATTSDLAIKTVPLISLTYYAPQVEALQELRSQPSQVATETTEWEGVVVSAFPPKFDPYGHVTIVKVKSPKFDEVAKEPKPRPERVGPDFPREFAEKYVNENRIQHVLDQVAESLMSDMGSIERVLDPLDLTNTGLVLKALFADVTREGAHDFDKLTADDKKLVGKALNDLAKPLLTAARDARTLALVSQDKLGQGETEEA
jgi:hypothetical protein